MSRHCDQQRSIDDMAFETKIIICLSIFLLNVFPMIYRFNPCAISIVFKHFMNLFYLSN